MKKVVAVVFDKMFQTREEVYRREKNLVLALMCLVSLIIVGYFMST